jgi:hypothetical protein
MILDALGPYVAASFMIMIFSFALIKANKFATFAQHTFTACSIANLCVVSYESVMSTAVKPIQEGNILFIVPIILGVLYLLNVSKEYGWISRYPVAVILGVGTGLSMRALVEASVLKQVLATASAFSNTDAFGLFNALVILVGALLSLNYFLFTRERTGVFQTTWSIGRYALMVMFGSLFGMVVMTRLSALIGQLDKLLSLIGLT